MRPDWLDHFEAIPDAGRIDWLKEACHGHMWQVSRFIPQGFESILRFTHPGWYWPPTEQSEISLLGDDENFSRATRVSWKDVATKFGRSLSGTTTWDSICPSNVNPRDGLAGYSKPMEGSPPKELLTAICQFLLDWSGPKQECLVAFWTGFGLNLSITTAETEELGQGSHYVMAGQLSDVEELYGRVLQGPIDYAECIPQAIWPVDRSWFLTSPFYIESTFLAGSRSFTQSADNNLNFESFELRTSDEIE